jgi:ribosome-interacting GTPase 1
VPALTLIGGVLVQLVEIPGLIEGASDDRGGGVRCSVSSRSVDAIVYCARADGDPHELEVVRVEIAAAGIEKSAVSLRHERMRPMPPRWPGSGTPSLT